MIFVTVGTHEQPMDRLFKALDDIAEKFEIVAQIGYATYTPKLYKCFDFLPYSDMEKYMEAADVIITHGGPGSIFGAIRFNKKPIVVPRLSACGEHVNDHQVEFAKRIEADGLAHCVFDIKELDQTIKLAIEMRENGVSFKSGTVNFCTKFASRVEELFVK